MSAPSLPGEPPAAQPHHTEGVQMDPAEVDAKRDGEQEMYPIVSPRRTKSVMQRMAQYKPVSDLELAQSFAVAVGPHSPSGEESGGARSKAEDPQAERRGVLSRLVNDVHNEAHGDTGKSLHIVDDGATMNMYKFVIGEGRANHSPYEGHSSAPSLISSRSESYSSASSRSSSAGRDKRGPALRRRRTRQGPETVKGVTGGEQPCNASRLASKASVEFQRSFGEELNKLGSPQQRMAMEDGGAEDDGLSQPTAQKFICTTTLKKGDDSVSLWSYWETLHSPALYRSILIALRTTIFAIMPAFVLVTHPNTAWWFRSGIIMPAVAGLLNREILGLQLNLIIGGIQSSLAFMVWGVIMNAVGAKNNQAGYWCAVVFGPIGFGLLGEMGCKRLCMMYAIIMLQSEHMEGGTELSFPCYFSLDIMLAGFFSLFATCIPYPARAAVRADTCMFDVSTLLGLCAANITKSFWAPVNVDAKASLSQVPFAKIGSLMRLCKQMIFFASYEPLERSLSNQLRNERLQLLRKLLILLHWAYGGAQKRIEDLEMKRYDTRSRLARHLEARMRPLSEDLSMEIRKSVAVFGKVLQPKDVAGVDTTDLDEKAQKVYDMVQSTRHDLLYRQGVTSGEVNMVLNACRFHESLVDFARELTKLKESMKNFDPTKYKSTWRMALEFFFLDQWNSFWDELPRRLTLATPHDVRIWKDAIKYSLAFAVACAFTLRVDPGDVYLFGMAILMRIAQQTASETLHFGVMRVFGLCLGAAFSFITIHHTHRYIDMVVLTLTFVFFASCFVSNPYLFPGAQYTFLVTIAGTSLASDPAMLMTRVADNVFAFIAYFLICTFVFPVDPMLLLWNARVGILSSINEVTQQCVALACTPVTRDKNEIEEMIIHTHKQLAAQQGLMKEYADWMTKSETEPLLRGGDYPKEACSTALQHFYYITAVQELMLYAIESLHRDRSKDGTQGVSQVFLDTMDVFRPFMEDMGRIVYAIMQDYINCTDKSTSWSVEGLLHSLWKANCAIKGLHHLIGNVHKNYIAALLELSPEEKKSINPYFSASFIEEKLTAASAAAALKNNSSVVENSSRVESPMERNGTQTAGSAPYGVNDFFSEKGDGWVQSHLLSNSFQVPEHAMWSPADRKAFGTLSTASELFLKSMAFLFQPMVRIHEFEKSRHPIPAMF